MNGRSNLWNRNFLAVCLSSFFVFLNFYTLAATLPLFVTDSLHESKQQIGPVMTVFIIAAVLIRPLAGKWLDESSKKKVLFYSLAIFMICSAGYVTIHNYWALLGLRFFHGVGFGLVSTATGAIAVELVPEDRKGEGVGYYSLFMSLAMVIGPFIGLILIEHTNMFVLFIVCFCLAFVSWICGFLVILPERAHHHHRKTVGWHNFIEPGAIPISVVGSLLAFSYAAIATFISVYAKEIGLGPYASYFFVIFAALIVLPRPITGVIYDRLGSNVLVYPGIVLFSFGMIWLSQANNPAIFLIAGGLIGLGFGALMPSFLTISIQASPNNRRGAATSTYYILFDSGYGTGSYALGIIAFKTSYHHMYFIAGIIVIFTAAIYYVLHHRRSLIRKANSPKMR